MVQALHDADFFLQRFKSFLQKGLATKRAVDCMTLSVARSNNRASTYFDGNKASTGTFA
jgi:hypothetical protein